MPRVSKAQAERNRAEIERVSAQMLLEHGLGVSVADVMAAAGLTHGGFYKHFDSKDEMTAAACSTAFSKAMDKWQSITEHNADPTAARSALIEHYLAPSEQEENNRCPMVSLAIDVSRSEQNSPVRKAFNEGFENLVSVLSSLQTGTQDAQRQREQALLNISTMVGAMVLAQATAGKKVSDELRAVSLEALSCSKDKKLKPGSSE